MGTPDITNFVYPGLLFTVAIECTGNDRTVTARPLFSPRPAYRYKLYYFESKLDSTDVTRRYHSCAGIGFREGMVRLDMPDGYYPRLDTVTP